jgi:hypothetical protein
VQEGEEGRGRRGEVQEEEEVKRYTFVVQIHPEGISTLENLSTQERVRIPELGQVGPQIERWLAEAPEGSMQAVSRSEPDRSESAQG